MFITIRYIAILVVQIIKFTVLSLGIMVLTQFVSLSPVSILSFGFSFKDELPEKNRSKRVKVTNPHQDKPLTDSQAEELLRKWKR